MTGESPTLASLWHGARRRWLVVLLPLVLVPAAVVGLTFLQTPKYRASAEVLLLRQNLANALTGTIDSSRVADDQRNAETQARIAVVPEVARRTLRAAGVDDLTTKRFLDALSVSASGNSDILVVSVADAEPDRAKLLATTHAREYAAYRGELDTAAIRRAKAEVSQRLRELEEKGQRSSPLYASLENTEQQLATIDTLQTARATVIGTAEETDRVAPRPVRNAALAVLFGAVLGLAAALALEALDTRVRRADEVARRLDTPLLGRLPEPTRRQRRMRQLVMLANPLSAQAEAFRLLRTNIEFAALGSETRIIELTSAFEGEGKTTSVSNLAIAFAHSGRNVVLVDLDLRRPGVERTFKLPPGGGITSVALGDLPLADALIPVDASYGPSTPHDLDSGRLELTGSLRVLPTGVPPPNPGEFVGSRAVQNILARLREEADIVLIDTPPLLRVGDAMGISSFVDGVLLVMRVSDIRRGPLTELCRLTQRMPAPLLGLIVTGEGDEGAPYSAEFDYGYYGDAHSGERVSQAPRGAGARGQPSTWQAGH